MVGGGARRGTHTRKEKSFSDTRIHAIRDNLYFRTVFFSFLKNMFAKKKVEDEYFFMQREVEVYST